MIAKAQENDRDKTQLNSNEGGAVCYRYTQFVVMMELNSPVKFANKLFKN